MRRVRWIWPAAATVAAVFAAPALGGVTVYAGPNLQAPPPGVSRQADALFFYPKVATIHAGESVTWEFRGFHTATFPGSKQPYPFFVPSGKQPATKDAAGEALWWSGAAPVLALSPLALLEQGSATISSPSEVRNSGLLRILMSTQKNPPAPYTLTFTRPGTYRYECAVHPGMRGVVRVLPSTSATPSPSAQEQQGSIELQHTIADVKRLNHAKPSSLRTVLVGLGHNATGAEIASFFPNRLVVNVGDTVNFRNSDETDIHTVTFGPEKLRTRIENTFAAPHGKRILLNPLGGYPSEPPDSGTVEYDGGNHGNGYLNSGILQPLGAPGKPHTFQVTFTKAGTYHYECVVHEHMDGTIVVR